MLIVCPSCASRYELDAAKLGSGGRKVRCASCQTLWHVDPDQGFPEAPSAEDTQALLSEELARAAEIDKQITAVAAEQEPVSEPATSEIEMPKPRPRRAAGAASKKRRSNSSGSAFRWTPGLAISSGLAMTGLVLIAGLAWQRNAVVRVAPQLASLFETLGMPVNVRGLSLTSIEGGLVQDGQGRFLVVEGDVTNITRSVTPVPPIEVALKDAAGQTLYSWTTAPPRASLEPAELVRFRARLAAPPELAKSVRLRFSEAKSASLAETR